MEDSKFPDKLFTLFGKMNNPEYTSIVEFLHKQGIPFRMQGMNLEHPKLKVYVFAGQTYEGKDNIENYFNKKISNSSSQ